MNPSRSFSSQRGASIITMLFVAVMVGFFMLMCARTFPALNEYLTVRKVVGKIMKDGPASPEGIREAFDRSIAVEYSIHSITGKDLQVQPLGDGAFRTTYAYNVEVPIFEPTTYLLLKFDGSARSGDAKGQ